MTETPEQPAPEPVPAEAPETASWHVPRLLVAWVFAAAFGVVVTVLFDGASRFPWLALAVGASTLLTFGLQIGTAQRDGFISRMSFSVAGCVLVIGIIDLVGYFFF